MRRLLRAALAAGGGMALAAAAAPLVTTAARTTPADGDGSGGGGNGKRRRVAIIGSGVGGASCAHFMRLRHEGNADAPPLDIVMFEAEPGKIGGRASSVMVDGRNYDSGGSIIHGRNRYMNMFVELCGLKKRARSSGDTMGLYDGDAFVFRESSWSLLNPIKLLWTYGYDVIRFKLLISDMLKKFDSIYERQERGVTYENTLEMAAGMSKQFAHMLHTTLGEHMRSKGFSERFIGELASAIVTVNYGQHIDEVNAFVGCVALAGAGAALYAVDGGSKAVPERLIDKSGVQLKFERVRAVIRHKDGSYSVESEDASTNVLQHQHFAAVVIAAPQPANDAERCIVLRNVARPTADSMHLPMERLTAQFIQGRIDPAYWKTTAASLPNEILRTRPSSYKSVHQNLPVDYDKCERAPAITSDRAVWKVFCPEPLADEQVERMFGGEPRCNYAVNWLAYPHYTPWSPTGPLCSRRFVLAPGLYYANAVESLGSAMEMAAVGGRNVAMLAADYLHALPS